MAPRARPVAAEPRDREDRPEPAEVSESRPDASSQAAFTTTFIAGGDAYIVLRAIRDAGAIVDWVAVDANQVLRKRLVPVIGEVVGTRLSSVSGIIDAGPAHEFFVAALESGQRQEFDTEVVLPAGEGGWRRAVVVPVDGDTVGVTTRDVSRERFLEDALEHERQALRALTRGTRSVGASTAVTSSETRLLSRSASALFFGAGLISLVNSLIARLPGVPIHALRATAVLSMLSSFAVPLLPWKRHARAVTIVLVGAGLFFLVASDHFTHYSSTESAVAVYPVFFIMIVAWSGLTQIRTLPLVVACASALLLGNMLRNGHQGGIGWQCVVVTMPAAAVLGEVLGWSQRRVSGLARLEAERRLRDPLTELANRHLFVECLDQGLARLRRARGLLAVLFIDLDRFKQINDSLGHGVGDRLLIEAADRLRLAVREKDQVARFGGDEFAVLCEDLDGETAAAEIAQRVISAFEEPFSCGKRDVYVSASIGIAFSWSGAESTETLLRDADAAMYRAKDAGRGRFEIFDETMRHWVASRLELESALRQALERDELRLYYQPIVEGDGRTVRGFEVLVRWERTGVGLVEPGEFIAVAEDTGMIFPLGQWVLREACRGAVAWDGNFPGALEVSVNVSSRQLIEGDIVEVVGRALQSSGLSPERLILELTETTLIDDAEKARAVLMSLKDLGVRIALDDFGTGYSSLTYLRTFPIDFIKIDASFVRTIDSERQNAAIVSALVQLADNLGIEIVAEGIETEVQLDTVLELGCNALQGYLFSPPRPGDDLAAVVAAIGAGERSALALGGFPGEHRCALAGDPECTTDLADGGALFQTAGEDGEAELVAGRFERIERSG